MNEQEVLNNFINAVTKLKVNKRYEVLNCLQNKYKFELSKLEVTLVFVTFLCLLNVFAISEGFKISLAIISISLFVNYLVDSLYFHLKYKEISEVIPKEDLIYEDDFKSKLVNREFITEAYKIDLANYLKAKDDLILAFKTNIF